MSSPSPQSTTQTTQVQIPQWLEPNLQRVAGDAASLYSQGVGPQYYPGQTWLDFNPMQTTAHQQIADVATSNNLNPRAYDTFAGIMDTGGVSQNAWDSLGGVHNIASGLQNINTGAGYEHMLGSIAGGNQFFQQQLANQSDRIADQVNSQFSQAGRYGSGAHTGVLADRIGELQTNALANQYNQDITNMYSGLAGLGQVQGTNIQNMYNAGMGLGNFYQGAQDDALRTAMATPALAQTRYDDAQRMLGLGDIYQQKQQEILSDEIARFEFANQQPWNQLSLYTNALQGLPQSSGQTQVTTLPQAPLGSSIFGGALAGAGAGSLLGPWGTLGGGLLGALGGGFLR